MGLVMAGLTALALLLLALWAWSLWGSLRRDRDEAAARGRQEQERRDREAREARLREPGARLRCLGCGGVLLGPLTDEGCPRCHLSALVVPEEETHGSQL